MSNTTANETLNRMINSYKSTEQDCKEWLKASSGQYNGWVVAWGEYSFIQMPFKGGNLMSCTTANPTEADAKDLETCTQLAKHLNDNKGELKDGFTVMTKRAAVKTTREKALEHIDCLSQLLKA